MKQIFNKGNRTIEAVHLVDDGDEVVAGELFRLAPNKSIEVHDQVAAKLQRMYKGEIIDSSELGIKPTRGGVDPEKEAAISEREKAVEAKEKEIEGKQAELDKAITDFNKKVEEFNAAKKGK